jgi:hypothetical protein
VIRERIGLAVLRAYPREVRAFRGEEMLGTLLDASEHSTVAFARECSVLWLAGMRERSAITARVGSRRLLADACCQAVAIWLLWALVNVVSVELAFSGGGARDALLLVVLVGLLACALAGYDRIVGICGLALIVGGELLANHQASTTPFVLTALLIPFACSAVMAFAPRRRSLDPRRLLWIVPAVVLAAIVPRVAAPGIVLLAAVSLISLLRLPADPRPAIACGIVLTGLGLTDLTIALTFRAESAAWLFTVVAALVMLAVAAARLHSIERRTRS